jgi:Fungal Zn(2)-Cys(6) binuclear cluster domain
LHTWQHMLWLFIDSPFVSTILLLWFSSLLLSLHFSSGLWEVRAARHVPRRGREGRRKRRPGKETIPLHDCLVCRKSSLSSGPGKKFTERDRVSRFRNRKKVIPVTKGMAEQGAAARMRATVKKSGGAKVAGSSVACMACRKVHVRCDRGDPCGRCTRRGEFCVPCLRKSERREQERSQVSQARYLQQLCGQFDVEPGALPRQRLPVIRVPDSRVLAQPPQQQQEQEPQEQQRQAARQDRQCQVTPLKIPVLTPATGHAVTGVDPGTPGSFQFPPTSPRDEPAPTVGDDPIPLLESHAPYQELLVTPPDLLLPSSLWARLPDGPIADEATISHLAALEFAELEFRYARLEQANKPTRNKIIIENIHKNTQKASIGQISIPRTPLSRYWSISRLNPTGWCAASYLRETCTVSDRDKVNFSEKYYFSIPCGSSLPFFCPLSFFLSLGFQFFLSFFCSLKPSFLAREEGGEGATSVGGGVCGGASTKGPKSLLLNLSGFQNRSCMSFLGEAIVPLSPKAFFWVLPRRMIGVHSRPLCDCLVARREPCGLFSACVRAGRGSFKRFLRITPPAA